MIQRRRSVLRVVAAALIAFGVGGVIVMLTTSTRGSLGDEPINTWVIGGPFAVALCLGSALLGAVAFWKATQLLPSRRIFISYRQTDGRTREGTPDSVLAGQIYDYLVSELGQRAVCQDRQSFAAGADFHEEIPERLAAADCVVVVVSPRSFLTGDAPPEGGPGYWYCYEIELSARLGKRIIPFCMECEGWPDSTPPSLLGGHAKRVHCIPYSAHYRRASLERLLHEILRDQGIQQTTRSTNSRSGTEA